MPHHGASQITVRLRNWMKELVKSRRTGPKPRGRCMPTKEVPRMLRAEPRRSTVDSASWFVPSARGRGIGKAMRAAVLNFACGSLQAQAAVTAAWPNGEHWHRRGDRADVIRFTCGWHGRTGKTSGWWSKASRSAGKCSDSDVGHSSGPRTTCSRFLALRTDTRERGLLTRSNRRSQALEKVGEAPLTCSMAVLLDKLSDQAQHGWSRNVLQHQLMNQLHRRVGAAPST